MDSHSEDLSSPQGPSARTHLPEGDDNELDPEPEDNQSNDDEEDYDVGLFGYEGVYEEEEDDDEDDDDHLDDQDSGGPQSAAGRPARRYAGPGRHRVRQGETLISIGHRYGLNPQRILDHPDNRHLVYEDRSTSILQPGDVLTLPEREQKTVDAATEQRHRFVYHGRHTTLRMKFFGIEGPLANEPYVLEVGDRQYEGELDGDGAIEERIPFDARGATIRIGEDGQHTVDIGIGNLNPISHASGIQMRLNNLGYDCGAEDGDLGPRTQSAIRRFQLDNDLEETGQLDDQTRDLLREMFGC